MPDGYEIKRNSVRVYFYWDGELCREPIGPNTPDNRERAEGLAQVIRFEIKNGTFDYARHFPDSPRVLKTTFGHYLDLYLEVKKNQLAASSYRGEQQKATTHIRPAWGDTQIAKIDHIHVLEWIQNQLNPRLGNKTIKEIISIMRQVFELYSSRNKKAWNPCKNIKINLPDKADPDPFTLHEICKIFDTPTKRVQELNLMRFMMWDGPRLSEALALCWEDVQSVEKGIITYKRAKVLGKYKVTKTRRSNRTHKLTKAAREVLQEQYRLTGKMKAIQIEVVDRDNRTVRKQKVRPVFLNTQLMKPHSGDQDIRERFWEVHLRNANVRYRPPSQCRHTFISQMLSTGEVPLHWIAKHVGHTTIDQIQRTYGKWIEKDGADILGAIEEIFEM